MTKVFEMRDNVESSPRAHINAISQCLSKIETQEREQLSTHTYNMIKGRILANTDEEVDNSFKSLCERYISSQAEVDCLIEKFKNCKDKAGKINFIVNFVTEQSPIPSEEFIRTIKKFLKIIKNDSELNSFLTNPQTYINNHLNNSVYDLQVLQFVINNPRFNNLPAVNRIIPANSFIYTPLTSYMYQLNLAEYGSTDAIRFPECINEGWEEQVLAKAKKNYYGPQTVGTGAFSSYTRKLIEESAKHVIKMKMGDCHNFAQLAANHFLKAIDAKKLPPLHIKMVSHNKGLGTHTFLLIEHDSDNLEDLTNCLIIDAWAVVMGHQSTYGIYNKDNYPFPRMLTKLVCCYDSRVAVNLSKTQQSTSSSSLPSEIKSNIISGSFFTKSLTPPAKKHLTPKQQVVIDFLNTVTKHAVNSIKKDLIKDLIKAVEDKKISPEKVVNLAISAFYARLIEKIKDKYVWKQVGGIDDALIDAFNKPSIIDLWHNFIEQNNIQSTLGSQIGINTIQTIVNCLNKNEEHEFVNQSTLSSNKRCNF